MQRKSSTTSRFFRPFFVHVFFMFRVTIDKKTFVERISFRSFLCSAHEALSARARTKKMLENNDGDTLAGPALSALIIIEILLQTKLTLTHFKYQELIKKDVGCGWDEITTNNAFDKEQRKWFWRISNHKMCPQMKNSSHVDVASLSPPPSSRKKNFSILFRSDFNLFTFYRCKNAENRGETQSKKGGLGGGD